MKQLIIPENYRPALNLYDTQAGIKTVKDFFQNLLLTVKPHARLRAVICHAGIRLKRQPQRRGTPRSV